MAAKIDAAIVAAALATSSEHIHRYAESKFRGTGIYYRFNVCEETNIKLFEHQKMVAMRMVTENYLQQASTAEYTRKFISQLQNLYVNPNNRDLQKRFGSPTDIQTLIESTIHPETLNIIQALPLESTSLNIAPEALRSPTNDYEVIPTVQIEKYISTSDIPMGHLVLSFNILSGGQHNEARRGQETYRRHKFQPRSPICVPKGRWRSSMAYMLLHDTATQHYQAEGSILDGSLNKREINTDGCIMLGMSVLLMRGDTMSEICEPVDEAATVAVTVPDNCGSWALVESVKSFEVQADDQLIFELWWDPANVSEEYASRSKLFFGGIRYAPVNLPPADTDEG